MQKRIDPFKDKPKPDYRAEDWEGPDSWGYEQPTPVEAFVFTDEHSIWL